MKTHHPTSIVVEIPEPIRSQVQSIRDSLGTVTAKLPVEITVAGSSGVGYIPIGTDLSCISSEIDKISSKLTPFEISFSEIRSFPNTFIFYLVPLVRAAFDSIHRALCASSIPFTDSPVPYTPHCTLRDGNTLTQLEVDNILSIPFPKEQFFIDTISVYDLPLYDSVSCICNWNLFYKKTIKA